MEKVTTLYSGRISRFAPYNETKKQGLKYKLDHGIGTDGRTKSYFSKFLNVNVKSTKILKYQGVSYTGIDNNIGCNKIELIFFARENLGHLCSGSGMTDSKIISYATGELVKISALQTDHFHPADKFKERVKKFNKSLVGNQSFVSKFQTALSKRKSKKWQFDKFLKRDSNKNYVLTDFYKAVLYNDLDNLWLIEGSINGKIGNKNKFPEDGQDIEHTFFMGEFYDKMKGEEFDSGKKIKKLYGKNFLQYFGTLTKNKEGKFLFKNKEINKKGVIYKANFYFDINGNIKKGIVGLGRVARSWVHYRLKAMNSFGMQLRFIQVEVENMNGRMQRLLTSKKQEKMDEEKGIEEIILIVEKTLSDELNTTLQKIKKYLDKDERFST